MQRIKLANIIIYSFIFVLLFAAKSTLALVLSIQSIPSYINTNSFKISCTSNGNTAQFYYSKNGGSFTAFGPAIDLSSSQCLVQIDSSVVNDQTTYTFKVNVDGTDSSTVSTIYDTNGPGTVSGYYKEGLGDGFRIHWRNPNDSDFAKVIIYRGETPDFSADGGHEVTNQPGGADSQMTYEDHFTTEPGKTYYYDLRAVDKAGNSSGLVGDGSSVTTQATPQPSGSSKVTVLPKEQGSGSVLGTETKESPSPAGTAASTSVSDVNAIQKVGLLKWMLTHKKITLGILIGVALLGYGFYYFTKKK